MFGAIVAAILFVYVGIPIILFCVSYFLMGVCGLFGSIVEFPTKVIDVYKKDGMKGLVAKFSFLLMIFDYSMFVVGLMCLGIAIGAKEKVAPLTYVHMYKVDPYGAMLIFITGGILLFSAIILAIQIGNKHGKIS